jgi:hypothetical protein
MNIGVLLLSLFFMCLIIMYILTSRVYVTLLLRMLKYNTRDNYCLFEVGYSVTGIRPTRKTNHIKKIKYY